MERLLFLPEGAVDYPSSRVVVLPVPWERTTSYGRGTHHGPQALLRASDQVELYDELLDSEPHRIGIATASPFVPALDEPAEALAELEKEARRHLETGRFLLALGGEHSLTPPLVKAASRVRGELGVVQFDAHADLRDSYEGTPYSHACVMRRVLDLGLSTLAVGIRALSAPEAALVRERRLPVIWGHQLEGCRSRFAAALDRLPERVYLTFDLDYFDPALLPATGTPEPGGGQWYATFELLRTLFASKEVVAMDLVELAPIPGQPASDFLAARLAYRCIGLLQERLSAG